MVDGAAASRKLADYEEIDWDSDEDEAGNLVHCLRPDRLGPNPERVVVEVLDEEPVQIEFKVKTAEFAVVGPDQSRSGLWLILFDTSHKRGDWLRPVTGWRAEAAEQRLWENQRGKLRP